MSNTISEKLEYLAQTKSLIREAIEKKGVNVPEDALFREYAELIGKISADSADAEPVAYLYNGVRLPPLPDRCFKYDFIIEVSETNRRLYTSSKRPIWNGSRLTLDAPWCFINYYTEGGRYKMNSVYSNDHTDTTFDNLPIWTNTDILTTDGSVYLAASEPVAVYE